MRQPEAGTTRADVPSRLDCLALGPLALDGRGLGTVRILDGSN